MSDNEADEEERRRAPLSRSRRLSSRRRRKTEEDETSEASDDAGVEEAAPSESPPIEQIGEDAPDFTQAVSLPSAPTSSPTEFSTASIPPAEHWAILSGALRRWTGDFSYRLQGLSRTASEQGHAFGREVIRPFSSALLEAALSLTLLFVMGVAGAYVGSLLKTRTAEMTTLTGSDPKLVTTPKTLDEDLFNQGFNTQELHLRANRVLQNYFEALKSKNLRSAYDLLSSEWQQELSFASFQQGYQTTQVLSFQLGQAQTIDPSHVRIKAEVQVTESGKTRTLQADYLAVLSPQGWRLDGGEFH